MSKWGWSPGSKDGPGPSPEQVTGVQLPGKSYFTAMLGRHRHAGGWRRLAAVCPATDSRTVLITASAATGHEQGAGRQRHDG